MLQAVERNEFDFEEVTLRDRCTSFVLPLLLVKGLCNPAEFADVFLATLCILPVVFGEISASE